MGRQKVYTGSVISNKMQKTIVVQIHSTKKVAKYGKIIKRSNSYKAHDEKNTAKIGDIVRIQECRPLSKDKRFRLIAVVKKTALPHVELKEEIVS